MKNEVIVIAGLPTSGKSTLGRALAEATGIHFVDIDDGPVKCAPLREPNPYRSKAGRSYEQKRMSIAYTVLHATIEVTLSQGFSVIVAAAYTHSSSWDFLKAAVGRGGGNLKVIHCIYHDTEEEIRRRIRDRLSHNGTGGCRSVQHYLDDKSRHDAVSLPHLTVTMDGGEEGTRMAVQ